MPTFQDILTTLGLAFLAFVIAAPLNYYCRYLEDNNLHPVLQKVITAVVILCFIPSIPVSIIIFPIGRLYIGREKRLDRQEEAARQKYIADINGRLIADLKTKNESLQKRLNDALRNRCEE